MLELTNFSLSIEGKTLLNNLSFKVPSREILTLMGPSGCGKSSLLHYLTGSLASPMVATGDITLNGNALQMLPAEKRHVGILFQDPLLFPHMTILENLLFALPSSTPDRKNCAINRLESFGLKDKLSALPAELSGGQQARVALLRTLLSQPRYLLLDEPFSKLDSNLRQEIRTLVIEQVQQNNFPCILVTHDEEDAQAMNGPIIRL
jgi:putative thiamine transport system ATP-binding protein